MAWIARNMLHLKHPSQRMQTKALLEGSMILKKTEVEMREVVQLGKTVASSSSGSVSSSVESRDHYASPQVQLAARHTSAHSMPAVAFGPDPKDHYASDMDVDLGEPDSPIPSDNDRDWSDDATTPPLPARQRALKSRSPRATHKARSQLQVAAQANFEHYTPRASSSQQLVGIGENVTSPDVWPDSSSPDPLTSDNRPFVSRHADEKNYFQQHGHLRRFVSSQMEPSNHYDDQLSLHESDLNPPQPYHRQVITPTLHLGSLFMSTHGPGSQQQDSSREMTPTMPKYHNPISGRTEPSQEISDAAKQRRKSKSMHTKVEDASPNPRMTAAHTLLPTAHRQTTSVQPAHMATKSVNFHSSTTSSRRTQTLHSTKSHTVLSPPPPSHNTIPPPQPSPSPDPSTSRSSSIDADRVYEVGHDGDQDLLSMILTKAFEEVQNHCQEVSFGEAVLGLTRMVSAVVLEQEMKRARQ